MCVVLFYGLSLINKSRFPRDSRGGVEGEVEGKVGVGIGGSKRHMALQLIMICQQLSLKTAVTRDQNMAALSPTWLDIFYEAAA